MSKNIFELQEELRQRQLEIQTWLFEQYTNAKELQLSPSPYLENVPVPAKHRLLRQERETAAQDVRERAKEWWAEALAVYATAAKNRANELEEALFGEARDAELKARLNLANMSEREVLNALTLAIDSNDAQLSTLCFVVAHSRDYVEARTAWFEALDPEGEAAALYHEMDECPSDEELLSLQEEWKVESILPDPPGAEELMQRNTGSTPSRIAF
jgi:hypothetical protein